MQLKTPFSIVRLLGISALFFSLLLTLSVSNAQAVGGFWTCDATPGGRHFGASEAQACQKVYDAACQTSYGPIAVIFTDNFATSTCTGCASTTRDTALCPVNIAGFPLPGFSHPIACPVATPGRLEYDTANYETGQCACASGDESGPDNGDATSPKGCQPPQSPKDRGCSPGVSSGPPNTVGNPCNVATGNKIQVETDFSVSNLRLTRSYNSLDLSNLEVGKGWRINHAKHLRTGPDLLIPYSASGRAERWSKVNGVWVGDADSKLIISETGSGFVLTKANGGIENYDESGRLLSTTSTNGFVTAYEYNFEGDVSVVRDDYGHQISLTYDQNKLVSVTDPLGSIYRYEYDVSDNLVAVVLPDTTPADSTDNPRKVYHYENTAFPNHLTGITDANGDRYATFAYDANGKAIVTEHAQTTNGSAQEKFELDFQGGQ